MRWPDAMIRDLCQKSVNGHTYETYEGLPINLYDSLAATVRRSPDKMAVYDEKGAATYRELLEQVDGFADLLHMRYQICAGDICALLIVNSIDFCIAFYAVSKLGGIVLPLSTKQKEEELRHPLTHSQAKLLVMDAEWMPNVKGLLPDLSTLTGVIFTGKGKTTKGIGRMHGVAVPPQRLMSASQAGDGAVLLYTSGTTGKPKAAFITHFNLLHGMESYRRTIGLSEADSTLISTPIFHITGLAALMGLFFYIGGTIHLHRYFQAEKTVECIFRENLTFFHASPTVFILMLEQRTRIAQLPSLRAIACGSANLPAEVIERLHEWVPMLSVHTVYGLTETSSPATIMPEDPIALGKVGSSGIAIPGMRLCVLDERGTPVRRANVVGQLLVKGSTVIERYWNAPTKAAQMFRNGWFYTGDMAKIDQDGFLYIVDRRKDMINHGGEKVYSIEVENVLSRHRAIAECAVFGVADPLFGEAVMAAVRLLKGEALREDELIAYMRGRLATYKLPVEYFFVTEFPRTENGKIRKMVLKENITRLREEKAVRIKEDTEKCR